MYKIDFTYKGQRNTKYFTSYDEAVKYCRYLGHRINRIKPVH